MPSESWSIQLLQPFAAVDRQEQNRLLCSARERQKIAGDLRPSQKVSQNFESSRAEGREYDPAGYLAVPGSADSFGGKEERLKISKI